MSRRWAGALVVAGLLVMGGGVAPAEISTASALAPTALLPPQLQALAQRMEQLQVNSEHFSEVSRGVVTVTNEVNGKPVGRSKHVSLNGTEVGEAGLSPAEGRIFIDGRHSPSLIVIGSTVYRYEPAKRSHPRRPWVRSREPREQPAAQLLPYHGGDSLEVDAGGRGPFARLINELTTAVGPVSVDGAVTVQGQATTEFTAQVEPRLLIKHITVEDVANFKQDAPIDTLHIFLTESGLPIRIVSVIRSQSLDSVSTTEILGVNVPVSVEPPPARETIAASLHFKTERLARRSRRAGR